jgi:hypothetical protein
MAKQTFKIGESCIGGIIEVTITGKVIQIKALDWQTKKEVRKGTTDTTDPNCEQKIDDFLTDLTSYYFVEKVMKYIRDNVNFKNESYF